MSCMEGSQQESVGESEHGVKSPHFSDGEAKIPQGHSRTLTGMWVLAGRNPSVGSQGGVFVGFCDGERTLQQESGSAALKGGLLQTAQLPVLHIPYL